MTLYDISGLSQKVELPVPLKVHLLPPTQTRQRPGFPRHMPGYWVQHETGNTRIGADAAMHDRWLHAGASGATLSFHFCVDDGVIYQFVPVNEVTWQAADGGGPGNMSGISCELCVNQGINKAKSRLNAEALCGGVLKALGMSSDRVKRHWDFNAGSADRHHCPDQMMTEGYWPTFVLNVDQIIKGSGASVPPKPPVVYPKPSIPAWMNDDDLAKGIDRTLNGATMYACRRSWKATKATPRYKTASLTAAKLGPDLRKGESFLGEFVFQTSAGWWILTRFGTRVFMGDCVPTVVVS